MTAADLPAVPSTGRSIARAAAAIAAVTVASRIVGLARVFVLARTVGDDPVLADTYQAANTLPNIVFEIVAGGALAAVVVPALSALIESGDRDALRRAASGLLTWSVVALAPLAVLGVLLRGPLMETLTADVTDAGRRATEVASGSRMLVVFMPQVVLYGVGIVLTGVLQAHRRFLGPAVAPLLSSATVIAAYVVYAQLSDTGISRTEELVLSAGTTLAVAVLSLSLVAPVRRLALGWRPTLRLPPGVGSQVRRLAAFAAAGVAAQQLVLGLVLRLAAPQLGGVFAFSVGYTVFLLPWAVLAVPVATSVFPELSRAAARGDEAAYAATSAPALRGVVLGSALGAAVLAAAAPAGARLVLGVNAGGVDPSVLADAIVGLAPGLVGYGILAVLTRALYARDDGRSPAVATVIGFAVTAAVDLVAVRMVGEADRVAVLAVGNSVGMTVAGVLLVVLLRRRAGPAATAGAASVLVAGACAGILGALAGRMAADQLGGASVGWDLVRAAAGALVAAAAFLVVMVIVRADDARAFVARVRGRRA